MEVGFLHVSIPRSFVIDPLIGTMKCWEQSELVALSLSLDRAVSW